MKQHLKYTAICAVICGGLAATAPNANAYASFPPSVSSICGGSKPVQVAYTHKNWNFWAHGGCFSSLSAAVAWSINYNADGSNFQFAYKVNGSWMRVPTGPGTGNNDKPTQAYVNRMKSLLKNAWNLKNDLSKHIGKLTDEQFNRMNNAIDEYNRERRTAQKQYPSYFPRSQYPYIAPAPSSWKAQNTVYTLEYRSASCSWCRWNRLNWTSTSLNVAYQAKNWASRNYPQYSFRVVYK